MNKNMGMTGTRSNDTITTRIMIYNDDVDDVDCVDDVDDVDDMDDVDSVDDVDGVDDVDDAGNEDDVYDVDEHEVDVDKEDYVDRGSDAGSCHCQI